MVEKQATRARVQWRVQRVETVARWLDGRHVAVPQYHLWLYADDAVGRVIDELYDELDPQRRRELWRWLLAWTAPVDVHNPSN
jgi:hypothetical protein